MNRVTTLLDTPLVRIARFDHSPDCPHCDPAKEAGGDYSVNFAESGGFELRYGNRISELAPGKAFLTCPGLAWLASELDLFHTDVIFRSLAVRNRKKVQVRPGAPALC